MRLCPCLPVGQLDPDEGTKDDAGASSKRRSDDRLGSRLLPQAFEPMPGNPGVMGGVLGIAVTQVVLHCAQVGALIGQVVAAGMAEHVRPDAPELCGLASDPHDIIDGLAGELCLPLGHEQPGQIVFPGGEVALDRAAHRRRSGARRWGCP